MSEILLCSRSMTMDHLQSKCGINTDALHAKSCSRPESISPFTPYLMGNDITAQDSQILALLSPPNISRNLTNLSLTLGDTNVPAIADIVQKIRDFNIGLIGAATSTYSDRMGSFVKSIKQYQESIFAVRDAKSAPKSAQLVAQQKAIRAYNNMQINFRHELNAVKSTAKARRGTPLTNPHRAINIATSSRDFSKLEIVSQAQAHNIVKLTQHTKVLGNGLSVIDFGSRVGNITTEYKAGGDWEREMFKESFSFAASAITASATVKVGAGILAFLVVATPIGWVGLLVGGLVVAGSAAGASIYVNNTIKANSDNLYDNIMEKLDSLWAL